MYLEGCGFAVQVTVKFVVEIDQSGPCGISKNGQLVGLVDRSVRDRCKQGLQRKQCPHVVDKPSRSSHSDTGRKENQPIGRTFSSPCLHQNRVHN